MIRILIILVLIFVSPCHAKPKYLFKVGSLAPEGSVWIKHFKDFAREVSEKSNGEIGMKIYPGGVMGDDLAMYRKIRAGQLHGGGFTMTGIASVVPDFSVMAVPLFFRNYNEIDRVGKKMTPFFAKKFHEKGLEFIALTEVGFIYAMSTSPIIDKADLRKSKSWIPTGDAISSTFLNTFEISPIPLTIPDVLSSLQTGLIDTVYTSLYGTIVMQWFNKATYITDFPFGYAYGAIAFSQKAFAKLPPDYATLIHESANKHFTALNRDIRKSNSDSRNVLQKHGIQFVETTPESVRILEENRDKTIDKLVGKSFSEEAFNEVSKVVDGLRTSQ